MRRILSLLLVISILTTTVFAGTYEPEIYVNNKPVQVEVTVKPEVVTVEVVKEVPVDTNKGIYFLSGFLSGIFVLGGCIYYYMVLKPKFKTKESRVRHLLTEKKK